MKFTSSSFCGEDFKVLFRPTFVQRSKSRLSILALTLLLKFMLLLSLNLADGYNSSNYVDISASKCDANVYFLSATIFLKPLCAVYQEQNWNRNIKFREQILASDSDTGLGSAVAKIQQSSNKLRIKSAITNDIENKSSERSGAVRSNWNSWSQGDLLLPFAKQYVNTNGTTGSKVEEQKTMFELLELFLCLLSVTCIELFPLARQHFQRQQQRQQRHFFTLRSPISSLLQQNDTTTTQQPLQVQRQWWWHRILLQTMAMLNCGHMNEEFSWFQPKLWHWWGQNNYKATTSTNSLKEIVTSRKLLNTLLISNKFPGIQLKTPQKDDVFYETCTNLQQIEHNILLTAFLLKMANASLHPKSPSEGEEKLDSKWDTQMPLSYTLRHSTQYARQQRGCANDQWPQEFRENESQHFDKKIKYEEQKLFYVTTAKKSNSTTLKTNICCNCWCCCACNCCCSASNISTFKSTPCAYYCCKCRFHSCATYCCFCCFCCRCTQCCCCYYCCCCYQQPYCLLCSKTFKVKSSGGAPPQETCGQQKLQHHHIPTNCGPLNYLQSFCLQLCRFLVNFIRKLGNEKKSSRSSLNHQQQNHQQQQQQQQRRFQAQRHTLLHANTRKSNCNNLHHAIGNATTNYHQLKANNLCKFFCNNRKRQRRRRRKRRRRRHCMANNQEYQSNNRVTSIATIIFSNNNYNSNNNNNNNKIDRIDGQKQLKLRFNFNFHSRLLSMDKNFLKQAFKTIIVKFRCIPQQQQQQQQRKISKWYTYNEHMESVLKFFYNSKLFTKTVCAMKATASFSTSTAMSKTTTAATTLGPQFALPQKSAQKQTFRRVCLKCVTSRPNLVWLFIGLLWFESSRLVGCYIQRQKTLEQQGQFLATSKVLSNHFKDCDLPSSLDAIKKNRAGIGIINQQQWHYVGLSQPAMWPSNAHGLIRKNALRKKKLQGVSSHENIPNRNAIWNSPPPSTRGKSLPEYSMASDQLRLESIKAQILSKLGLTGRPNVTSHLPKQYIWDTISRVDELGKVIKNFDFVDRENIHYWHYVDAVDDVNGADGIDNMDHLQVRVTSNSTQKSSLHESYKYSEKQLQQQQQEQQQFNSVSPKQNINKYIRDNNNNNNSKNVRNRKNNNNNNKLTYLSGITTSGGRQAVPVAMPLHRERNSASGGGSSSNPKIETDTLDFKAAAMSDDVDYSDSDIDSDSDRNVVQLQYQRLKEQAQTADAEPYERTEEIISFAEKGQLFSHHRLVEFAAKGKNLRHEKWIIRKAQLHLRIDLVRARRQQHEQMKNSRNLKIWIFRMEGSTNITQKTPESDGKIYFCAAFDIDTRFLGWKKLDITEAVRQWHSTLRAHRVTSPVSSSSEKLRLLIDCTGCGDQYKLHLFDMDTQKESDNKKTRLSKQPTHAFRNDIVAHWVQFPRAYRVGQSENDSYPEPYNKSTTTTTSDLTPAPPSQYRAFLVIRAETLRSKRVRRRAVDCSGALRGQCCKESFYVSFKALGWDDWIIAPRGYFANYCRGDCTGPFRTPDTFQTFHAHFIEEYRKMGLLNGMKPCCAPIKFSSMSLIYYGDDGIIKRDLPKMVVDECGCP